LAHTHYFSFSIIIHYACHYPGFCYFTLYLYTILIYLFCDGASRGNPGPASIGVVAYKDKGYSDVVFTLSQAIGKETNNVAEWTALLFALQKCKELSEKDLKIHLDSELVVRQMQGIYKTKNPDLQKIKKEVDLLKPAFSSLEFIHVPRERNKMADKLANQALDAKNKEF
jgi:ribonuclease HI